MGGAVAVGEQPHRVSLDNQVSCEREDHQTTARDCKHIIAPRLVCERDHNGKAPEMVVDEVPKRPTFKQNWKAYNAARSVEKDRFQELLADLCRCVPEPDRARVRGRKPFAQGDCIFAMALKVYTPFSGRRCSSDLRGAHARGHTARLIPGQKAAELFENPAFTPILKELIARSSLPLRAVETKFAIDPSGFSTCKFERWFDHAYGVTRQKAVWVKLHMACGVKTHVVTAVRVLDKDSANSPQFAPLVRATAKGFAVEEVSADKAYDSLENIETVAGCGGTRFKSNHTGNVGGLFVKMFHYFRYRRDEFLAH